MDAAHTGKIIMTGKYTSYMLKNDVWMKFVMIFYLLFVAGCEISEMCLFSNSEHLQNLNQLVGTVCIRADVISTLFRYSFAWLFFPLPEQQAYRGKLRVCLVWSHTTPQLWLAHA